MDLHLIRLQEMHPVLPLRTALEYEYRAAIGLARHGHTPGVRLAVSHDGRRRQDRLHWREASPDADLQLDFHRVTEDAAEAVALALVHAGRGWTIVRRLQHRERGDWLLVDAERNHIALEVSGIDQTDSAHRRLREKVGQVRQAPTRGSKVACAVELAPPRCTVQTA